MCPEPARDRGERCLAAKRVLQVFGVALGRVELDQERLVDRDHGPMVRAGRTDGSRPCACGQALDEPAQDARVGVELGERCERPLGRLVGAAARLLRAVREHEPVAVEQVVDELEERADLLRERGQVCGSEPQTASATSTAASKSRPVFCRLSDARSSAEPVTSRYWPPIIPSVASASSRATAGVS